MNTAELIQQAKQAKAAREQAKLGGATGSGSSVTAGGVRSLAGGSALSQNIMNRNSLGAGFINNGTQQQQQQQQARSNPATVRTARTAAGGGGKANNNNNSSTGLSVEDIQRILDQQAQRAREREADHKAEMLEREKLWEATASHVMVQLQQARAAVTAGGGGVLTSAASSSALVELDGLSNNRKRQHAKPKYDAIPEDDEDDDVDTDDNVGGRKQRPASQQQQQQQQSIGILPILNITNKTEQISRLAQAAMKMEERLATMEKKMVGLARKAGRPSSSSSNSKKNNNNKCKGEDGDDRDGDDDSESDDNASNDEDDDNDMVSRKSKSTKKNPPKASTKKRVEAKKAAAKSDDDDDDNVPFGERSYANKHSLPTTSVAAFAKASSYSAADSKKKAPSRKAAAAPSPNEAGKRRQRGDENNHTATASSKSTAKKLDGITVMSSFLDQPSNNDNNQQQQQKQQQLPSDLFLFSSSSDHHHRRKSGSFFTAENAAANPLIALLNNGGRGLGAIEMNMLKQQLSTLSSNGNLAEGAVAAVMQLLIVAQVQLSSSYDCLSSTPLFSSSSSSDHSKDDGDDFCARAAVGGVSAASSLKNLVGTLRDIGVLDSVISACQEFANHRLASHPDDDPDGAAAAAGGSPVLLLQSVGQFLGFALGALQHSSSSVARAVARSLLLDSVHATLGGILRSGLRRGSGAMSSRAAGWVGYVARLVSADRVGSLLMFPAQQQQHATYTSRRDALALALEVAAHFIVQGSGIENNVDNRLSELWTQLCDELDWPERLPPLQHVASSLLQTCASKLRSGFAVAGGADEMFQLITAFRLLSHVVSMQSGFANVIGALDLLPTSGGASDNGNSNSGSGSGNVNWDVACGCIVAFLVSDFNLNFSKELAESPELISAMHNVMAMAPDSSLLLLSLREFAQLAIVNAVLERDRDDFAQAIQSQQQQQQLGELMQLCMAHAERRRNAGAVGTSSSPLLLSPYSALYQHTTRALTAYVNSGA